MFPIHLTPVDSFIVGGFALKTFKDAVKALSRPDAKSSKFYRWFFNFTNAEAADLETIFAARFPSSTGAAGSSNSGDK